MPNNTDCVLTMTGPLAALNVLATELTAVPGTIDFELRLPPTLFAGWLGCDEADLPTWYLAGGYNARIERGPDEYGLVVCFQTAHEHPQRWVDTVSQYPEFSQVTFELLFADEFAAWAGRVVYIAGSDSDARDVLLDRDGGATFAQLHRFVADAGWDFGWGAPDEDGHQAGSTLDDWWVPRFGSGALRDNYRGPQRCAPGMLPWAERHRMTKLAGQLAFLGKFADTDTGLSELAALTGWPREKILSTVTTDAEGLLDVLMANPGAFQRALDRTRDVVNELMYLDRQED